MNHRIVCTHETSDRLHLIGYFFMWVFAIVNARFVFKKMRHITNMMNLFFKYVGRKSNTHWTLFSKDI